MPILKLKSIDEKKACLLSTALIDDLQTLMECQRDYFSIELIQSKYIVDGQYALGLPIVEVFWFDRGQEMQDRAAQIITEHINSAGYRNVDVIFHRLEKNRYYENGQHF